MGPGLDGDQGLSRPVSHLPAPPAPPAALAAAGGAGGLAGRRLPGLAGRPVRRRVLAPRLVHLGDRQGLLARQLPDAWSRTTSTGRSRCARSASPRRSRSPTRCSRSRSRSTWPRSRTPRARAMLVVAVLMPLWSSYLVKVYAWRTILSEDGDPQLGARPVRAQRPRLRQRRHVARLLLPVAAVHDPADLRGPGADPGLAARRVGRPRRAARAHLPARDPAAGAARASSPARSSRSR